MLDTLKYSKHLQSAGVSQAQADAQAEALRDAVTETVATKAQLENVEQRLDAKIDGVEQRLDAKIDGVEQRLDAKIDGVEQRLSAEISQVRAEVKSLRWVVGLVLGLVTTVLALTAAVLVKLMLL
ncbi:MAG: CCDC90 family protein [Nitrococcus sp.]|nr:CCDC90 family protein [Nitrococcus sp.]